MGTTAATPYRTPGRAAGRRDAPCPPPCRPQGADGDWRYYYDYENTLTKAEKRESGAWAIQGEYARDALGRRIERVVGATTIRYYYDGIRAIEETEGTESPTVERQYVFGNGIDEALVMYDENGGNYDPYYYLADPLWTVEALLDSDAAIVEAYAYRAYGQPTIKTGAGNDATWFTADDATAASSACANQITFTGREYLPELGHYYFRARIYDAGKGVYLSPDPAGYEDGMSLYLAYFVPGRVDPGGLWAKMAENTWCADKETDTLQSLASRPEYGGNPANWSCLWPTEDTADHGYISGKVAIGDKYDASNLAATFGPILLINMDPWGLGGKLYQDFNASAVTSAITGSAVDSLLAQTSGEGRTPIAYIEFEGHGGGVAALFPSPETVAEARRRGLAADPFIPGLFSPNSPPPSFARAMQRRGPRRCWFTRNATGHTLSCQGRIFNDAFAATYLRAGTSIKGAPTGMDVWVRRAWWGWNDWGMGYVGASDPVRWYDDIWQFKAAPIWWITKGSL